MPPDTATRTVAAARSRVRLFGMLLVALIVSTWLDLPFRLAGIVFGGVALWVGVRALILSARVRRMGGRAPGRLPVSVGLGVAGVVLLFLLAEAAFYPLVADLERCLAGANTNTARARCQDESQQRLTDLVERLQPPRP